YLPLPVLVELADFLDLPAGQNLVGARRRMRLGQNDVVLVDGVGFLDVDDLAGSRRENDAADLVIDVEEAVRDADANFVFHVEGTLLSNFAGDREAVLEDHQSIFGNLGACDGRDAETESG